MQNWFRWLLLLLAMLAAAACRWRCFFLLAMTKVATARAQFENVLGRDCGTRCLNKRTR